MKTKSSREKRDQVLGVMPRKRVEEILREWANLRREESAFRRFTQRYSEVFPPEFTEKKHFDTADLFGQFLRLAWDAPTQRKRDWYLEDAASFYHHSIGRVGDPPALPTALEALVYYFRRNADRALHCPNPDCVTPYFLATKKGQKYCSDACALPAQRAAKRKWWNENKGKSNRSEEEL